METAQRGLKKSLVGLLAGFAISFSISSVLTTTLGGEGRSIAVLVNLVSILIGIANLERAKYWGIMYTLGYFMGLFLLGNYFMEPWEWTIYVLIVGAYVIQKIIRRARREF